MPKAVLVLLRGLSALVAFVIVAAAVSLWAVVHFNSPPETPPRNAPGVRIENVDSGGGSAIVEVKNGESAAAVGSRLEEAGIIRSRLLWTALARLRKDYVKTGSYRLELPAAQTAIYETLVSGKQLLVKVTVPEGETMSKTARILEEAGICTAVDFIAAASDPAAVERYGVPAPTLEGYLFPDTYLFPPAYAPEKAVAAMLANFRRRVAEIDPAAAAMSGGELQNKVTIASIVEREYRVAEEAPLMAGVFYNRLGIGMALQSCATVEYVITEIQGRPHPEMLLTRDTEIQNPYNTYTRRGLPPGPICSPGVTALRAAFFPEKSDYLYFRLVNAEAGRHYFSRSLDEHIKAGALYTKSRR